MATTDTVTDTQIEQLRTEAATAGDLEQVALCTLALCEVGLDDEDLRETLRRLGDPSRQVARARCAEVIRQALAQG